MENITCEEDCLVSQSDLNKIVYWSNTLQKKFNTDKYKVIHFEIRKNEYDYKIDDSVIRVVSEEKDLGVLMNEDLKFAKMWKICYESQQSFRFYFQKI